MREALLGAVGLCMGMTIASGVVAFIISLGIVPRFAGITRSATLKVGNFGVAVRAYQHLRPNDISDCSCCPSRVCHFI